MKSWEILHNDRIDRNPIIAELFSEINYADIDTFVDALCRYQFFNTDESVINAIELFHEKSGTLNNSICSKIRKLHCGARIVLMAHQPNIFPSIAIMQPIFYLVESCRRASVRSGIDYIPLFLFVDYDSADDRRFHSGYFPILSKPYRKNITLNIPREKRKIPMYEVSKPESAVMEDWIEGLRIAAKSSPLKSYCFDKSTDHYSEAEYLIRSCYEKSITFTELNEFFIDHIVNKYWGLDVLFFEGHELHRNNSCLLNLMKHSEEINSCYNDCIDILINNGVEVGMKKRVIKEEYAWQYRSDALKRYRIGKSEPNEGDCILPDVIYDNLLDIYLIGKIGAVGYYKQAEHVVISNYILKHHFQLQPCPQLLIDSQGIKVGSSNNICVDYKAACEDRQCSILFFLAVFGFELTKNVLSVKLNQEVKLI